MKVAIVSISYLGLSNEFLIERNNKVENAKRF